MLQVEAGDRCSLDDVIAQLRTMEDNQKVLAKDQKLSMTVN